MYVPTGIIKNFIFSKFRGSGKKLHIKIKLFNIMYDQAILVVLFTKIH